MILGVPVGVVAVVLLVTALLLLAPACAIPHVIFSAIVRAWEANIAESTATEGRPSLHDRARIAESPHAVARTGVVWLVSAWVIAGLLLIVAGFAEEEPALWVGGGCLVLVAVAIGGVLGAWGQRDGAQVEGPARAGCSFVAATVCACDPP